MKFLGIVFCCVLWASVTPAVATQLKEIKSIKVCAVTLNAEVARTEEDRSRGLMGRSGIQPGTAMLFVFKKERELSFWMKNVPFDIDIGFFDAQGRYVSHATMRGTSPMQREDSLRSYPSGGPAAYAVEVAPGFFTSQQVKKCRMTPLL